jgi:restriction system protein
MVSDAGRVGMGRSRGFFAELQYQNQLAARRQAQAERAYVRVQVAAQREAERAFKQAERAAAQASRATAAEQKAAEKEAKRLHEEARNAEVAALNARLGDVSDELNSILAATLGVDDFVDLEELRVKAEHPPFSRADLETPTPEPAPITAPPEPVFVEPVPAKGLGAMFGGKKKHAEAVAAARAVFDTEHQAWQSAAASVPAQQLEQMQKRDAAEQQRLAHLEEARQVYQRECDERETEAAETNRALDELIVGLRTGSDAAVQEYVGIVLGNSVYPEVLEVEHDFEFDSELKELTLTVLVSAPDSLPAEKEFKWVRSKDEITATALPKKDVKERYANVVFQVALRTLHEVFEADRAQQIQTISLAVATETSDPATGLQTRVTFVAVAAERSSFISFDLSNIVPLATLHHLGAEISKSPYDLVSIDQSQGVRTR